MEINSYSMTILFAVAGVLVGAILGFINGWARASYPGDRTDPPWFTAAFEAGEADIFHI